MSLKMYFWLLDAGRVNKNLAVEPSSPGVKHQLTSYLSDGLQKATYPHLFSQLLTKGVYTS